MTDKKDSAWTRTFLPRISPFRFFLWFFRWRNIQRILFVLACLATLIALFYAEENWRGRRAWENYKHEQEAKGVKFEWQAFVPPAIPDDQNFAMADFWAGVRRTWDWERKGKVEPFESVYGSVDDVLYGTELNMWRRLLDDPGLGAWYSAKNADMKGWQEYYRYTGAYPRRKDVEITNEFPVPATPGEPAADVLFALSKDAGALEKLRAAGARPLSRFPITYERGFDLLLPHLAKLKSSETFLLLWTTAELELGRTNEAFDDVKLMFVLADSVKTEPIVISHLVRAACQDITMTAIWDGMRRRSWTEPQLKYFQDKFEAYNMIADFDKAVIGHRAECLRVIDDVAARRMASSWVPEWRPSLLEVYYNLGPAGFWKEFRYRGGVRFDPHGWFDLEKVRISKAFDERLALVNSLPQANDTERMARLATNVALDSRLLPIDYQFTDGPDEIQRAMRAQIAVNLAAVACALERYDLANGEYPEKLDALAPAFIAKVPREILTGEPFKYRPDDNGRFVLYSLGLTNKDSGGVYRGADGKRTGNWVWRYPAK